MPREGLSVVDAGAAGRPRLLPILLTTATAIGGLLPVTFCGGMLWTPLGWTIIGGLMVSMLLMLVVVPVLYSLLGQQNEPPTSDEYGSLARVFPSGDKIG